MHLIRARCSSGISLRANVLWLVASILLAIKAIAIQAWVFVVLGGIQVVAITVILFYARRYKDEYCSSHITRTASPFTTVP